MNKKGYEYVVLFYPGYLDPERNIKTSPERFDYLKDARALCLEYNLGRIFKVSYNKSLKEIIDIKQVER